MPTTRVYTTAEDGHVQDSYGFLSLNKTAASITMYGNSAFTDEARAFWFIPLFAEIPAGATVTAATFACYVNLVNIPGFHQESLYYCNNCLGSTLDTGDFNAAMTLHSSGTFFGSIGLKTFTIPAAAVQAALSGTMGYRARFGPLQLEFPSTVLFSAFEHADGNKAYLDVTYTAPPALDEFIIRNRRRGRR
jgi:hypothetical protein